MKTAKNENMFVTSNPHITDSMNTPKIMSLVILALLPSLISFDLHIRLPGADAGPGLCDFRRIFRMGL